MKRQRVAFVRPTGSQFLSAWDGGEGEKPSRRAEARAVDPEPPHLLYESLLAPRADVARGSSLRVEDTNRELDPPPVDGTDETGAQAEVVDRAIQVEPAIASLETSALELDPSLETNRRDLSESIGGRRAANSIPGPSSATSTPSPAAALSFAELDRRHGELEAVYARRRRADRDAVLDLLPAAQFYALETFHCALCGAWVRECAGGRREHEAGTVHLLNRSLKGADPPLVMRRVQLSERNKGFQLLARLGFDELGGGLGLKRQGRLDPVATALKVDRAGLGHAAALADPSPFAADRRTDQGPAGKAWAAKEAQEEQRPTKRVTHFPSHIETERAPSKNSDGEGSESDCEEGAASGRLGKAKAAQDALGGRPAGKGVFRGQRRGRKNRRSIEERLEKKREAGLKRELYGGVPEGYEKFF